MRPPRTGSRDTCTATRGLEPVRRRPAVPRRAIGRRVRLGIITNGELDFQSPNSSRTGLAGRFEHLVASGEYGVAKPDPRIFEVRVRAVRRRAGRGLYVGDRLQPMHWCGAAGLTGVWLDRRGAATAEELAAAAQGVRVIRSLADLPALAR